MNYDETLGRTVETKRGLTFSADEFRVMMELIRNGSIERQLGLLETVVQDIEAEKLAIQEERKAARGLGKKKKKKKKGKNRN